MPIQTFGGFSRISNMCKTIVPDEVTDALEPIKGDDAAVKDYGVKLAKEMIGKLWSKGGVRGYHFCTLNVEKSVYRIVQEMGWTDAKQAKASRKVALANGNANGHLADPRLASLRSSDATDARRSTDSPASWDEYPNGRFGDARSPAYGDLDGWGVSLKLTPSEALRQWGTPVSYADISQIFVRYLQGTLAVIPWSDEPLRSETNSILPHLLALNTQKNWWTVGSQPAVDGCPSEDPIHGFGPEGGYVYQKAFVEFFGDYEDVLAIQRKAAEVESRSKRRKITFYAACAETESSKSIISNMAGGDANAVTWGIFPGKEIVTTTLIEEMSFVAWKVSF
jgi:methylenetetrahydrofolate reductase (NADPH)